VTAPLTPENRHEKAIVVAAIEREIMRVVVAVNAAVTALTL